MANNVNKYDHLFKILVVGDSFCGKSNLISRFCSDTFENSYIATGDMGFKVKKNIAIDNKIISLQIWDTFNARFRMVGIPYRGAHGVLIVYDVNDIESYKNVRKWYIEVERYASSSVLVGIVGTKTDISEINHVNSSLKLIKNTDALDFAHQVNSNYHEVSSKFDYNVNKCFIDLVYRIYEENVIDNSPPLLSNTNINFKITKIKKKQNCIIS